MVPGVVIGKMVSVRPTIPAVPAQLFVAVGGAIEATEHEFVIVGSVVTSGTGIVHVKAAGL